MVFRDGQRSAAGQLHETMNATTALEISEIEEQSSPSSGQAVEVFPRVATRYLSIDEALLLNAASIPSSPAIETILFNLKLEQGSSVELSRKDLFEYRTAYDSHLAGRLKLARRKAMHFNPRQREARIHRALQALNTPGLSFSLDKQTWMWIAQEADIEDL